MYKNHISKATDEFIKEIDDIIAKKQNEINNKNTETLSMQEYADFIINESELDISNNTIVNSYRTKSKIIKNNRVD